MVIEALRGWTTRQKHAVAATYFAWSLDTFDYFVLVFVLAVIARQFHAGLAAVAFSTTLTLRCGRWERLSLADWRTRSAAALC